MTNLQASKAASGVPLQVSRQGFSSWEQTLSLDSNPSFFAWGGRVLEAGLAGEPASAFLVERLGDFLAPVGICSGEVEGATGLPPKLAHRLFRQIADSRDKVRKQPRNFTLKAPEVTVADVRDGILPPDLRHLRETPLDPVNGDEYVLDPKVCARLLGMRNPRLAVLATVAISIQRSFYPFARPDRLLRSYERLEDLVEEAGEDVDDPDGVARIFDAYLVHRTLYPKDSDALRELVTDVLFASRGNMLAYASLRPEHRTAILATLPTLPSKDCSFERENRGISKRLARTYQDNRKRFSDPLTDRLDPVLSACRLRRNQVRSMELKCRVIERKMLERDDTGTFLNGDEMDFSYRERVITPSGRRLITYQRVYMRAHRQSALVIGHSSESIVFEYLRVEGDGARRHDPWFVELFASGALSKATRLPPDQRDRRREVIIRHSLPDFHDKPAALVAADGKREAALLGTMLSERGMVLIPVWALSHAMTLAYLMLRVMAYSFCRIGEALQMTYHVNDPDHWSSIVLDGKAYQAFLAVPKGWEETDEFLIDDTSARLIADLALLTKEREPSGALLPCEAAYHLTDNKRDGEKLYVFAFRGRPMTASDMNYMFRILTVGFGKLRSHDIRHAAANCADKEKMGMKMVKLLLRHRGQNDSTSRHYAKKTKAQIDRAKARFFRDAEARDMIEAFEEAA